jgi:peptidylprolyl isomerase
LIESSLDYGQPIPFVYGKNQMILGIEEAVGYMKVGGKSRIIAPSNLGFGDIKIDENLPANSTLVIDLELVGLYDHQE